MKRGCIERERALIRTSRCQQVIKTDSDIRVSLVNNKNRLVSPCVSSSTFKVGFDHQVHWHNGSHSGTPKRSLYLHAVVRAINLVVRGHGVAPP